MSDKAHHSDNVKDMLTVIESGILFESFAQEFITARLGYNFSSSGGIKDRGIDGFEHTSELEGKPNSIFQITIDKKPKVKLKDTLDKLEKNNIDYRRLTYVTNIEIKNKDELIDYAEDKYDIIIRIFDGDWIAKNTNYSPSTQITITNFMARHLREMQKPGREFKVNNYINDPKLYIYLMQQIGRSEEIEDLNNKLIDSLILYSLRDTDPDENRLMSAEEIEKSVRAMFDFEVERLRSKINKRLKSLCKKPNRKVNHHKRNETKASDFYCLPYETRLQILADNVKDKKLYDSFMNEAESIIRKHLKSAEVQVRKVAEMLRNTVEVIYYQQGLEFSDFLLNGGASDNFEKNLSETVDSILDSSNVIDKNRGKVKTALIMAIRELVYSGSTEAKEYLRSLSKTYLMLFLMKCDPQIISYFQTMAGKMRIFVCTSILVPAFSEIYLEDQNKRYWTLLKSARLRGVRLLVNDTILDELLAHLKHSNWIYEKDYLENIDLFDKGAEDFVDQILLRAFLYAKNEGKTQSYSSFLENFVTVNSPSAKQELIDFLYEEFGIEYVSSDTQEMKVEFDKNDYNQLCEDLTNIKGSASKARADANLILTIYALRSAHGEMKSSFEGYKTWWLSSDTATHRAVSRLFKQKYPVSCYMRPDFLYNYISFTPPRDKINSVYKNTFPNLLGVQISNHISADVGKRVRKMIVEQSQIPKGRVKAKIRKLSDDLKAGTGLDYSDRLISFFNE